MKTKDAATEIMDSIWLIDESAILKIIKKFESDIRAEKQETRIKELTSIGEFKTSDEANEYCKLHGVDGWSTATGPFQIAGALMDARKDQGKVIRHECAEIASSHGDFDEFEFGSYDEGVLDTAKKIHQEIMNTKSV